MMYPYNYSYEYYYTGRLTCMVVAILAAVILSVVLYFTFLRKKNEGKYKGFTEKIYNFFNFNKFYVEEILKLVYIVSAAVLTVVSLVSLFSPAFFIGLITLILGNVALRIAYELIMMFIIICRKTVSVDKKLDKIAAACGNDKGCEADEECKASGKAAYETCRDEEQPSEGTCGEAVYEEKFSEAETAEGVLEEAAKEADDETDEAGSDKEISGIKSSDR